MIDITGLRKDKRPQSSIIVHALLDRLEAAEADALEQARLNGLGSEREAALMAKLEAAEKSDAESLAMYRKARDERDALRAALQHEADCVEAAKAEIKALRAKIEAMERQEPVAAQHRFRHPQKTMPNWSIWQPCAISNRPAWAIDSQGYEVEYRPLYALPGAKTQGEEK